MPKAEREKGRRRENQIVAALEERGIDARRISRPYISSDDLEIIHPLNGGLTGEVKARANASGWKTIKTWKRDADLLFLVEDKSIYLEEYARGMIGEEEQHSLELRKMLKDFG